MWNPTDVTIPQQPGQTRPGQARPGQTRPDQARPDQARPGQARPDQLCSCVPYSLLCCRSLWNISQTWELHKTCDSYLSANSLADCQLPLVVKKLGVKIRLHYNQLYVISGALNKAWLYVNFPFQLNECGHFIQLYYLNATTWWLCLTPGSSHGNQATQSMDKLLVMLVQAGADFHKAATGKNLPGHNR